MKLTLGDIVHYTNHGGDDGASTDLKPAVATPQHPLAEPVKPLEDQPMVLPAMVVAVNDLKTGDVDLCVWYGMKGVLVRNCLPFDKAGGSHEAKGKWTPRDRELFNWDAAAHRVDGLTADQRDRDARKGELDFKDLPPQGLKPGEPDPKGNKEPIHRGPVPPMHGPHTSHNKK